MSLKVAFSALSFKGLNRRLVGPLQQSAHKVVCLISDVIRRVKNGYCRWWQQYEFKICCLPVFYTTH